MKSGLKALDYLVLALPMQEETLSQGLGRDLIDSG